MARLDARDFDSKLRQAAHVAQCLLVAPLVLGLERRRIKAAALHWDLSDVNLGHFQTRSMIVAVPMPTPMQRVTSAVSLLLRSSSSSTVPMIMAPVAPSGWPMAMAPPFTLILSCEMSSACM